MTRFPFPAQLAASVAYDATVFGPRHPSMPPPQEASSALIAGRFEIVGLIGVGGMGSVYRARDVTLDEMVALKVIGRDIAREPGMLERFRREVKLARRVTHPNVARCFDIGQDGDDRFFTMELVDGESLGARLTREQRLTASATVAIALDVCAGLGAAHRAGVVHRDLKPDNVLLAQDGRVVLTDFGIASARLPNDGASRTIGVIVGTPEYMAPEQVEGMRELDGRADIYSLGVMMFELVTGTAPWKGPTPLAIVAARLAAASPPDPRTVVRMDGGLAALIMRCMARRRDDRFADVDELARALRSLDGPLSGAGATPLVSSNPASRTAFRDKSVMVCARADEDDELARAVAAGLGDLVERHLRGTSAVRIVAAPPMRLACSPDANGPLAKADSAHGLDASIVIEATVALASGSVAVDVELVNVVDGVVLSSRQYTGPRSQLFATAAAIAHQVAEMLLAGHAHTLPRGIDDSESLDLWLHARVAASTGAPFARDRAVAMFERATARSPNDLWVLAGYAATLVERFRENETPSSDLVEALGMAERVIASTDVLGEAWLARALVRHELGDPCGAVTDSARAGQVMPGFARVHLVRGQVLCEAGETERGRWHLERANALDPSLIEPRLELALEALMAGSDAIANAMVDDLLDGRRSSPEAWLIAARCALWSCNGDRARALRTKLDQQTFERQERAAYVLDVASGGDAREALDYFAWLAEGDSVAARRTASARKVEAEIAAASGDLAHAIDAIDAAAATAGFFDVSWLARCPLFEPLQTSPRLVALHGKVSAARRGVLEILHATQEKP